MTVVSLNTYCDLKVIFWLKYNTFFTLSYYFFVLSEVTFETLCSYRHDLEFRVKILQGSITSKFLGLTPLWAIVLYLLSLLHSVSPLLPRPVTSLSLDLCVTSCPGAQPSPTSPIPLVLFTGVDTFLHSSLISTNSLAFQDGSLGIRIPVPGLRWRQVLVWPAGSFKDSKFDRNQQVLHTNLPQFLVPATECTLTSIDFQEEIRKNLACCCRPERFPKLQATPSRLKTLTCLTAHQRFYRQCKFLIACPLGLMGREPACQISKRGSNPSWDSTVHPVCETFMYCV